MAQKIWVVNDQVTANRSVTPIKAELAEYGFKPAILGPLVVKALTGENQQFNQLISRYLGAKGVRSRINQLFGWERSEAFLAIHLAQKLTLMSLTGLFFILAGWAAGSGGGFYLLGLTCLILIHLQVDKNLEKRITMRRQEILTDWPEFLNVLLLLVGAGLPFQTAFIRAAGEHKPDSPLSGELQRVVVGLQQGKALSQELEELSRRCRIGEITRLVAAVLPVLRQGGPHLIELLTLLTREAWEKRKDLAVKQGEEAGAKLVFPMVMVFIAISILVIAPAIITMDF